MSQYITYLIILLIGIIVGFWLRMCSYDNQFIFVNGDWYSWGKIDKRITDSCKIGTLNSIRQEFGDKIVRVEVLYG